MDRPEIFLRLVGVSKSFGARTVVDSVDLEVRRGEIFGVLGPSGCGKTTLIRLIAGLERPDRGCIEIAGRVAVSDGKPRVAPQDRQIGFIFQDLALWPHLTVARHLDFVLASKGISRPARADRIREVLDLVHLSGFEKAYPHTLSGGEQQRLAVARALVGNPALLLLDEPLSSLDYQLRIQLQHELLKWLKGLKATAMLITHDQTEALAMADRLAVMYQGRFVQVGTPDEIRNHPSHDFVQQFLIGVP
jgi:iron(III) transport system ATP-binding protein